MTKAVYFNLLLVLPFFLFTCQFKAKINYVKYVLTLITPFEIHSEFQRFLFKIKRYIFFYKCHKFLNSWPAGNMRCQDYLKK